MNKLILTPLVLAAAGCAAFGDDVPPGPTAFDVPPAPPIVQIGMMEPALATPSLLRPLVDGKPKKQSRTVTPRTVAAATVFAFEEDHVFPIATTPNHTTTIYLAPGETMQGKALIGDPDPAHWAVEKTIGGTAKGPIAMVVIKPGDVGLSTNLVIPASRHVYHVDLRSYAKPAMDLVRFTFPATDEEAARPAQAIVEAAFDPDSFSRNFTIRAIGEIPRWMPQQVFEVNGKTYVGFPPDLGRIGAPALFSVEKNGTASPLTYRLRGRWFEVDQPVTVAELRLEDSTVQIKRGNDTMASR